MLEYWMGRNDSGHNGSIEDLLQNPGSVVLFQDYPRWLLEFAAGCCILFILVGIPGNLITLAALLRTKKLRNATAIFIMNLSISDLMFCCFNLPLATSTFWHSSWRHGPLLCRLFPLLRYGLVAVSLFTILAITINRYVMIGHPRLYPVLYKQNHLIPMILSTWVLGFGVLAVTWLEIWGRFGLDPEIGSCSILPDVHGRSPKEFLFVFAFLTPCIAIVVCYARIFGVVRGAASRSRKWPRITGCRLRQDNQTVRLNASTTNLEASHSRDVSTSSNQRSSDQEPTRLQEDEHPRMERSKNPTTTYKTAMVEPGSAKGSKLELRFKLEDIPFADEFEESREPETNPEVRRKSTARATKEPAPDTGVLPTDGNFSECENSGLRPETRAVSGLASKFRSGNGSFRREEPGNGSSASKEPGNGSSRWKEPGRMSRRDRKLLKMILVIFASFLVCYLPITVTKIFRDALDWRGLNIAGYLLIYLTTCINPVVYVAMSNEYRSAYKNVLLCRPDPLQR